MLQEVQHRPGTQDEHVFREIFAQNCYRIPYKLQKADVVIDVGAHIGCFSLNCLLRGAGKVHAYEPDRENRRYLEQNTSGYLGMHVHPEAIWRSDRHEALTFTGYPGAMNACGTCLPECDVGGHNDKVPVRSIGLDRAISRAGGKVRILKLDCEGAEFPALYTSKRLYDVDVIVGECHEIPDLGLALHITGFADYTMDELANYLDKRWDYRVDAIQQPAQGVPATFLFWARR